MLKLLGAAIIVIAAASVGIRMARAVRIEERYLSQLAKVLEMMAWEIESRLTAAAPLCDLAALQCSGALSDVFSALAKCFGEQDAADAGHMMDAVLLRFGGSLPASCHYRLRELGSILGAYEADEQVQALNSLRSRIERSLEELREGRPQRCRSYEVMGVCAGCALAILLL